MSRQRLPVYLINIARAVDRLAAIRASSLDLGIEIQRIEGVDGSSVAVEQWVDVDRLGFARRHGRSILPGEYGCYRSHLMALHEFLASESDAAIVIEDDVELNGELIERALAAHHAVPAAGIIKLVNHRWKGFREHVRSSRGDQIGRCLFGPQGSTACYLVTRSGAENLLRALAVMNLPWDVAVERGWDTNVSIFATRENLAGFSKSQRETMIGRRRDYRAAKLAFCKRIPAHIFRTVDFFRRLAYVLSPPAPAMTGKAPLVDPQAIRKSLD